MSANGIRNNKYRGKERRVGKNESINKTITGKGSKYNRLGSTLYNREDRPQSIQTKEDKYKFGDTLPAFEGNGSYEYK